ncbi:MAG: hypothetical protein KA419_16600 [Acidobacteria bacterium]|nr:hypothetical protein [Acidobacteriota bacterium]
MGRPDPIDGNDPGPASARPLLIRKHPPAGRMFVLGLLSWSLGNLAADQLLGRPPEYVGGGLLTAAWLLVFSAFWLNAVACVAWSRVGLEIGPDGVTVREAEHFGLGEQRFPWAALTGTSPVDGAILLHEAGRVTPVDTRDLLAGADWIARRAWAARPPGHATTPDESAPGAGTASPCPGTPPPGVDPAGEPAGPGDSAPLDAPGANPPPAGVPPDTDALFPEGGPAGDSPDPADPPPPAADNVPAVRSAVLPDAGVAYFPPAGEPTDADWPAGFRDASDDRVLERWVLDGEARLRLLQWTAALAGAAWVGAAAVTAMGEALRVGRPETFHHYVYRGFLPCLATLLAGFALSGWIRRVVRAWVGRRDLAGWNVPPGSRAGSDAPLSREGFRVLDRVFGRLETLFFTHFVWLMGPLVLARAGYPLCLRTLTPLCAAYLAGNLLVALIASAPLLAPARRGPGRPR